MTKILHLLTIPYFVVNRKKMNICGLDLNINLRQLNFKTPGPIFGGASINFRLERYFKRTNSMFAVSLTQRDEKPITQQVYISLVCLFIYLFISWSNKLDCIKHRR